jgi:hypothetical protein
VDSLYSNSIRAFAHQRAWPKGLEWTIYERNDGLNLYFVLFRDNFNAFDGEDRLQIAMMVKELMEKVRGDGVPIYMQVVGGPGTGWLPGMAWNPITKRYEYEQE